MSIDPRPPLPSMSFEWPNGVGFDELLTQEWLLTNGQGSYASSSLAACNTRRYHALFIPSLPAPYGRTVMLPRLVEHVVMDGRAVRLDCEERVDGADASALQYLRSFRLDGLLPEWVYQIGPVRLRRRIVFVHGENTVFITWDHLEGPEVGMRLRPFPAFRFHDRPISSLSEPPHVHIQGARMEIDCGPELSRLKLRMYSACPTPFVAWPDQSGTLLYRVERARGLDHTEVQQSPGYFECTLPPATSLSFGVTVGSWDVLERDPLAAYSFEREREAGLLERVSREARSGTGARLVLAADQFIIDPVTRPADEAWARATGQDARSVIAGYPWFTDWGRDTMISLEGLTLCTGRLREAAAILRTFQHYVKDGLLPNLFPEGGREGLYHTADATLWFFHAIDRYLQASNDQTLLRQLMPTLESIVDHHLKGTHYGIQVDPSDGLLRQGASGYQLTWMDAKVGDWVVTPRRGKAVELNALWFNALRLMADWAQRLERDPKPYLHHAEQAQGSFNTRFWNPEEQALFDIVDGETGNDPAVRPNQIFALSLEHPVLVRSRWEPVLQKVETELLTPVGLRTLSPRHPDYKAMYDGDLRARDAAYHQGTAWAWLIGHFVDAHMKIHPERSLARGLLQGLEAHLREAGIGQISEIFDASPPFRPRGCIAQAWSVAEMLRAWLKTT
jgi:predicted glycogen debranching enzyme